MEERGITDCPSAQANTTAPLNKSLGELEQQCCKPWRQVSSLTFLLCKSMAEFES
jgi:hypothetical protein